MPANEHGCYVCVCFWLSIEYVRTLEHVSMYVSLYAKPNNLRTHVCVCMRGMLVVS